MEAIEGSFFKKLWDLTREICHRAQIPLYVERHDPKVFTTIQKVFLWLYKTKKKLTLRGLVDDLRESRVVEFLRLRRVPSFSVLSYFLTSIPTGLLNAIDATIQSLLPSYDAVIVDGTGFECTHPSHYYCLRRNSAFPVDGFITLHAIIDQENGFVRVYRSRAKKTHDAKVFKRLLQKLDDKPRIVYADRGYDSEENYSFVVEKLGAVPLLLQKNMLKPVERCKGLYRREMRETFDYGEYLKRNKIEAIFSSIKRKYGSTVTTRNIMNQRKEITLKIIIYN